MAGSVQCPFPEAITAAAEQSSCWGISGCSSSGTLLRVASAELFPAACLPGWEGANGLAPQFIKLCIFVTRCEPVLYINFPKLLHAGEITSHGAGSSGKRAGFTLGTITRWRPARRASDVRGTSVLQPRMRSGSGDCHLDRGMRGSSGSAPLWAQPGGAAGLGAVPAGM